MMENKSGGQPQDGNSNEECIVEALGPLDCDINPFDQEQQEKDLNPQFPITCILNTAGCQEPAVGLEITNNVYIIPASTDEMQTGAEGQISINSITRCAIQSETELESLNSAYRHITPADHEQQIKQQDVKPKYVLLNFVNLINGENSGDELAVFTNIYINPPLRDQMQQSVEHLEHVHLDINPADQEQQLQEQEPVLKPQIPITTVLNLAGNQQPEDGPVISNDPDTEEVVDEMEPHPSLNLTVGCIAEKQAEYEPLAVVPPNSFDAVKPKYVLINFVKLADEEKPGDELVLFTSIYVNPMLLDGMQLVAESQYTMNSAEGYIIELLDSAHLHMNPFDQDQQPPSQPQQHGQFTKQQFTLRNVIKLSDKHKPGNVLVFLTNIYVKPKNVNEMQINSGHKFVMDSALDCTVENESQNEFVTPSDTNPDNIQHSEDSTDSSLLLFDLGSEENAILTQCLEECLGNESSLFQCEGQDPTQSLEINQNSMNATDLGPASDDIIAFESVFGINPSVELVLAAEQLQVYDTKDFMYEYLELDDDTDAISVDDFVQPLETTDEVLTLPSEDQIIDARDYELEMGNDDDDGNDMDFVYFEER